MDNNLYDMIFKRKSFHLFRNIGNEHISEDELKFTKYWVFGRTIRLVFSFKKYWNIMVWYWQG